MNFLNILLRKNTITNRVWTDARLTRFFLSVVRFDRTSSLTNSGVCDRAKYSLVSEHRGRSCGPKVTRGKQENKNEINLGKNTIFSLRIDKRIVVLLFCFGIFYAIGVGRRGLYVHEFQNGCGARAIHPQRIPSSVFVVNTPCQRGIAAAAAAKKRHVKVKPRGDC